MLIYSAKEMQVGDKPQLGHMRVEGSMGGQGAASALAVIRVLKTEGLKVVLDHNLDLTDRAYAKLVTDKRFRTAFRTAYVPDLNTLAFYPRMPLREAEEEWICQTTDKLDQESMGNKRIYIAHEDVPILEEEQPGERKRRKMFRMVMTHPYTTPEIVDEAFESLLDMWQKVVRDNLPPDDERTVFQRI